MRPWNADDRIEVEEMIIDYELAENCQNPEVYYICYKCGACGRKFENGILIEEGEEDDEENDD